MQRHVVGTFGGALVLAGTAALIWIVPMAGKIDALASDLYFRQPSSDLGYGELELFVRDLRLAPWTLLVAGTAVLISLRLSAATRRRVLAITGLILLCSPVVMGEYVAYGDWVETALPTGYVVAVPTMQIALTASGLLALMLAARRVSGWHGAAIGIAVAIGPWMVGWYDETQWPWFVLSLPAYVGLMTAVAVAGEVVEGRTLRRIVVAGVVSALAYLPAAWMALFMNFALGAAALDLNGGHIDVDGLPIYLAGPLSAWMAVLTYLVAVNHWTIFIPKAEREAPIAAMAAPNP